MVVLRVIPTNKKELIHTVKCGVNHVIEYFPQYKVIESDGTPVMPEERLNWGPTVLLSIQHVLAMFGSTVVGPLLMGFSPNTALLFSGVGTIIFYICTGGKVPSYLGSSFAFIGVVNSATGYIYSPGTTNPNTALASGGIMICGIIYLVISFIVMVAGHAWLEFLTPPIVTGSVVISIGLHLSSSAINQAATSGFDAWMAFLTVMSVILVTCFAPGPLKKLPILIGGVFSYIIYLFFGLGGIGPGINFDVVRDAKWIGAPPTVHPEFSGNYISLIAPVAIILAAENIGHLKAVATMTDKNLDKLCGRMFLGDSIATVIAGACGSIGTTTYAENIGVMSITKIFSTISFVFAAIIAIILGCLPVFGAVIQTIPPGIFGGLSIVLFGITAVTGAKLWINAQVDFSKPRNLLTAGISIVLGTGMITVVVEWGTIKIDGIGCATFSAVILYQILREDWPIIFRRIASKVTGRNFMKPSDAIEFESTNNGDNNNNNSNTVTPNGRHELSSSQIKLKQSNDSSVNIDMNNSSNTLNNSDNNNNNNRYHGDAIVFLDKSL